jgi:hypothetical protein
MCVVCAQETVTFTLFGVCAPTTVSFTLCMLCARETFIFYDMCSEDCSLNTACASETVPFYVVQAYRVLVRLSLMLCMACAYETLPFIL